ncbi:MAG: DUF547 domain-containing protein [Bacteroidia bacterium]|nr:DUF547 domain-containing protein [Bacteroidia bacterium]
MKKIVLSSLFLILFAGFALAQNPFFASADAFLRKNVDADGLVSYTSIKASPGELKALVAQIASFPYSTVGKSEQKAFLINAYNILMIKSVVDHYPIAKPTDVPGIFDKNTHTVAGQSLTLSDIENKKLRVDFPDSRLHFALVCGALSCPPLANTAFMPATLETQLSALTTKALNNPRFIKAGDGTVAISKIFEWYKADFDRDAKSFLDYLNKYRTSKLPADTKVTFYEYNWALNIKKN